MKTYYHPTPHLRFAQKEGRMILQQWWRNEASEDGFWRDIEVADQHDGWAPDPAVTRDDRT